MTTPTTSTTTTAAPATGTTATAAAGQGTTATTDPTTGSLFTTILQSLGGPALTGSTTTIASTTGEEARPGETAEEDTTDDGTTPLLGVDPAALAALVPAVLLVPATAAETALPTGGDAPEGVVAAPAVPAAIPAGDDQATVAEIPVAVTAATTVAVADALPTTPAPADEPLSEAGSTGGEDGEGAMPLPTILATTPGTPATTAQTAAAAAAQTAHAAPVAAAQAATAAPAEPTTAVAPTGDRPERKERASASDAVAAAPAAEGQASTAATVSVTGGTTTSDTLKAEATAGSIAHVDHERFERLADGLAARLRVSLAGDGARVRMHLTPRELGEVVVRLELKDGKAHAHLIADTPDAGRMLTAAMGDLRTALSDRGLRLDTVDVRVSGDAGGPMQGHTGSRQEGHGQQKAARMPLAFGRLDALQASEAPLATGEPAQRGVSVLA